MKKKNKVAYLGPEGTFSHQAGLEIFKKSKEYIPTKNITEIFKKIEKDEVEYGIVPIENSTTGLVTETIFDLITFNIKVNGSYDIDIHHNLLSKNKLKEKDIKTIKSHPQALAQCRSYLEKKTPNAILEAVVSSAKEVNEKNDEYTAFVGSKLLAKMHSLKTIAKDIEDVKGNTTKFYVLNKNLNKKGNKNSKSLVLVSVIDRVGVLRDILSIFVENGVNLTKLHSIPSRLKKWDYFFFIETDKDPFDKKLQHSLKELRSCCKIIKVLGRS